jgi:GTP-binding protein Era
MAETKCGLIALAGVPNVGKSSLLNALVGEKVGIVSAKPNTTRVVVRGVVNRLDNQFIFVDTPGLREGQKGLDRLMVQQARGAVEEADIVCYLAEATHFSSKTLRIDDKSSSKKVLVLTKVDKITPKSRLLPLLEEAGGLGIFDAIVPVSVRGGGTVEGLLQALVGLLPVGPWLFPGGFKGATDAPLALRLAELTREQAMNRLHDEVPYGLAVLPAGMEEPEGGPLLVRQTIVVTRDSQKPIVLGKGGAMLKAIGSAARQEMRKVLGRGVRLELHVEVDPRWAERADVLRELGLG